MADKPRTQQWWWTKVFVPVIGSGGVITLLVAGIKSCSSKESGGGQSIQARDINGNVMQAKGNITIREALKLDPEAKAKLEEELARVNHDIAVWENGVFETNLKIVSAQSELALAQQAFAQQTGSEQMVEAKKQIVALRQQKLATYKDELAKSQKRRSEIEQLLLKQ